MNTIINPKKTLMLVMNEKGKTVYRAEGIEPPSLRFEKRWDRT